MISEVSENVMKLNTFLEEYEDELEDVISAKKVQKTEGKM